ncbi:golgin subfamily A member 6-like protein 25 [Pungitius pungitius]|uniref:golgin subfamily A member 6-like protein 25 n=1 Tax=Pungitius pungitius TaxID=134920 RepID=UPI002E0DAF9E
METLNEDLKENDGELELIQQVIKTLMHQKEDLKTQSEVLISQQHENQTTIQKIEKRINHKINQMMNPRKNKDEGKLENLQKREKEHQELLENTGKLMDSTEEMINKMTERRGRILRDEEKIRKKLLKEAERKREETQSSFESEREQEGTLKTSE